MITLRQTKDIIFDDSVQLKITKALEKIYNVAAASYGPKAGIALIEQPYGAPTASRDGVTNLKKVYLPDPVENMVSEIIKQASEQNNRKVGDGPQPLYSLVLTPTGFVRMGDIEVGMSVCGTNSSIQGVVGVYEKGEKEIYRVTMTDGRVVDCCEDHLWVVATPDGIKKTLTVRQMIDSGKIIYDNSGNLRHGYFIQRNVVEFEEKVENMPLDPYLLGVLLGDGSLSGTGQIELSLGFKKRHILDKLILPIGVTASPKDCEKYIRTKILGRAMVDSLKKLGLYGVRSETKFIPDVYLYSSIASRKALLQGLLDTDGYINNKGLFEFSTVSPQLAGDFTDLTHGLGYDLNTALHTRNNDPDSYSRRPIFRIAQLNGRKYGMAIDSIEPTGEKTEMRCIKVSNPDNLYVTDGYVVTHNTTAVAILAFHLYVAARRLTAGGHNRMEVATRLNRAAKRVLEHIDTLSVPVNKIILKNVSEVASGDENIGAMIADVVDAVGVEGGVTIEDFKGLGIHNEIVDGFYFRKGYTNINLINDPTNLESHHTNVPILITEKRLATVPDIAPILDRIAGSGVKDLVIVGDVTDEALSVLLLNRMKGIISTTVVDIPVFAGTRSMTLEDLAVLTGGGVFMPGAMGSDFNLDMLGVAARVEITGYSTAIIGADGATEDVDTRVEEIRNQLKEATHPGDIEAIKDRLARLTGKVAIIRVGGATEIEQQEVKLRVQDAVCAVQAAIRGGVCPGGGVALARVSGVEFMDAYKQPFKQLVFNAGLNPEAYLAHIEGAKDWQGFNLNNLSSKPIDMLKTGIIDPTLVLREVVQNANSIVSKLIIATTAITYSDRDNKKD